MTNEPSGGPRDWADMLGNGDPYVVAGKIATRSGTGRDVGQAL